MVRIRKINADHIFFKPNVFKWYPETLYRTGNLFFPDPCARSKKLQIHKIRINDIFGFVLNIHELQKTGRRQHETQEDLQHC